MITHEDISKRAREIWEREGRPEGRDMEHWLQAEAELREGTIAQADSESVQTAVMQSHAANGQQETSRKRTARRGK